MSTPPDAERLAAVIADALDEGGDAVALARRAARSRTQFFRRIAQRLGCGRIVLHHRFRMNATRSSQGRRHGLRGRAPASPTCSTV
jgi:hypothetical protein